MEFQRKNNNNLFPSMESDMINQSQSNGGLFQQKPAILDTEAFLVEMKRNVNEFQV